MDNRILFVNKRPGLIEEFVSAMSEFDFTVDSTTNAVEALKFLEKAEYKVVVTGLIMEGMDGVQLISKINQDYPSIACVVLTTRMNVGQLAYLVNQLDVYRMYLRPVDLKGQFAEMLLDALLYYDHRKQYMQKQLFLQSGLENSEKKASKLSRKVQNSQSSEMLFGDLIRVIENYTGKEIRNLNEELLVKRNYFLNKLLHQFMEIRKDSLEDWDATFLKIGEMNRQFENGVLSTKHLGEQEYPKIVYQKLIFLIWIILLRATSTKKVYHMTVDCDATNEQKLVVTCDLAIDLYEWHKLSNTDLGEEMIGIAQTAIRAIVKSVSYEEQDDRVHYLIEIWSDKNDRLST